MRRCRLIGASGRPLNFPGRSRYGTIRIHISFNRPRAASTHLPAASELLPGLTCNRLGGVRISMDVSMAILNTGFRLDRRRFLAGSTRCPLAPGVVGSRVWEDQVSVVRCSVCKQIPSMGPEGLPELWV